MRTFKRVLAWILVVVSILGVLGFAAGIVGSWVINTRLTNGLVNLVSGVQGALSSVEDSLNRASTQLQTASSAVATIRDNASQLGEDVGKNTPLLDKINSTLSEQLGPGINKIRDLFQPILERIQGINNTLETLNALPGINLPTLSPQIQALNDQIQQVTDAVQQLQANLVDFKTGVVKDVLDRFLARVDQIANFLTNIQQDVNTYLKQVGLVQVALESLKAKIPPTIDAFTILFTMVLVWGILSQISLLLAAWLYIKTGRMIWGFLPKKHIPETPALAPEG
jgi:uncharacterized phage infection (PIP) family protein YhgE